MEALLYFGAVILGLICVLTVLIILMQRPSANAGMGAALGGGAAESAFGGEANNVLTRATSAFIVAFLGLSLLLFLGFKFNSGAKSGDATTLKNLSNEKAPVAATPATTPTPATPAPAATTPPEAPATVTTPEASAPQTPATPAETKPAETAPAVPTAPAPAGN